MKRSAALLVLLLAVPACGGGDAFDADAARQAITDEFADVGAADLEAGVLAARTICEQADSDFEQTILDQLFGSGDDRLFGAIQAGCSDRVTKVIDNADPEEFVSESGRADACNAALATIEVAIEAWYASGETGDPASIADLENAEFVRRDSGAEDYVDVIEGGNGVRSSVRRADGC